jgi:hypothetical protein
MEHTFLQYLIDKHMESIFDIFVTACFNSQPTEKPSKTSNDTIMAVMFRKQFYILAWTLLYPGCLQQHKPKRRSK